MDRVCLCINVIFVVVFLILYFARRKEKDRYSELNAGEHVLKDMYPVAELFFSHKEIAEERRLELCRQISLIILILLLSHIFSFAAFVGNVMERAEGSKIVVRPPYGSGDKDYTLYVSSNNGKLDFADTINFRVSEISASPEEAAVYFSKLLDYACKTVLGDNSDEDNVTGNLNLIRDIPGTKVEVEWELGEYSLFERNGERKAEADIPEEGIEQHLLCSICYEDFEVSRSMTIRVMPRALEPEEELLAAVKKKLAEMNLSDGGNNITLPEKVGDVELVWSDKEETDPKLFMVMGLLAVLIVPLLCRKESEKQKEKRALQMQMDYPYIIDKFLLLLASGATIRSAWERIVADYVRNKEKSPLKGLNRYAYEEMLYTKNKLAAGMPESKAYEEFGKRCGLLSYMRFATLVTQNLKKGTKGIVPLLELEAKNALADRRQTARKLGEVAGTKLLFPMMGFLVIVMLIVIVPALQII